MLYTIAWTTFTLFFKSNLNLYILLAYNIKTFKQSKWVFRIFNVIDFSTETFFQSNNINGTSPRMCIMIGIHICLYLSKSSIKTQAKWIHYIIDDNSCFKIQNRCLNFSFFCGFHQIYLYIVLKNKHNVSSFKDCRVKIFHINNCFCCSVWIFIELIALAKSYLW